MKPLDPDLNETDPADPLRLGHGADSQRLLRGLLADYSFEATPGLSSASIVRMLGEFGISPAGARTALSRVVRRGLLEPSGRGRTLRYNISPSSRERHVARLGFVVGFGGAQEPWDGRWCVVAFSVAERQRSLRSRLRLALEKLGFAPMTDAVWVCPHDRSDAVAEVARELGVAVSVLRAREHPTATGMAPLDAFPLDALRAPYEDFLERFRPTLRRAERGRLLPAEALRERTAALRAWRSIALGDPDLPRELLPRDWPQERTHELFLELWRGLAPLALERLRELIRDADPEAAEQLDWVDLGL